MITQIDEALEKRELIKITLLQNTDEVAEEVAEELTAPFIAMWYKLLVACWSYSSHQVKKNIKNFSSSQRDLILRDEQWEKRQARQGADVLLQEEPLRFQTRKQVGLLGGNFNPVHLAHLVMADQVQNQLGLDKVYLMPTYLPPHVDEKKTISSEHRLAMLELAVADNPCLDIEPIELIRKGKSYTYDTMKALKEANPDTDYYFIIGGDMVEYLPKWHRIDDLLHLVQFVGIRRPNYPTESTYPIIWVDVPQMAISSTLIRQKVKSGCSIRYLLPENVINYIQEKDCIKMSWITNYDLCTT